MSAQIEKDEFLNQSGGWVGAVVIGPKGDERGVAVAAGETIWLSEAEQVLTANAPRRPEDNPFEEQVYQVTNPETGDKEEIRVTPLVQTNSNRLVPAQARRIGRDIPDAVSGHHAQVAAQTGEAVTTAGDPVAEREAEVLAAGETAQPGNRAVPAPQAGARARAAAQAAQERAEATVPPPVPAPDPEPEPEPEPELPPQLQGEGATIEEETAVQQPQVAEETGAAVPPQHQAVEGSFRPGEEVGTPEAPAAEEAAVPAQPAPYTPQERADQPEPDAGSPDTGSPE